MLHNGEKLLSLVFSVCILLRGTRSFVVRSPEPVVVGGETIFLALKYSWSLHELASADFVTQSDFCKTTEKLYLIRLN